ncbi:MAG: SUMF1/EgtB/PvdO family nonheme iron enzyme [Planctomycetota bacterium]
MSAPLPRPSAVAHRCPRCGAAIEGDFKFCPTCAYRLRPGAAPPEDERPGSRDRWLHALVFLTLGLLVVGVLLLGFRLFLEPPPEAATSSLREDTPLDHALTVRGDLVQKMVNLPRAAAGYWPAPPDTEPPPSSEGVSPGEPPPPFQVMVGWMWMSKYEITRGMYAEYVRACEAAPGKIPRVLRDLWNPPPTGDAALDAANRDYRDRYVDVWWEQVAEHLQETTGREVDRPPGLKIPLPPTWRLLLMVPPSWIYLTDPFEEFAWRLSDEITVRNLPVTEVSWFDAVAFADWASDELGKPLRLPGSWDWMRGGCSGEPDVNLYPWGVDPLRYACNNYNFWEEGDRRRLLPVDYRYSDADGVTPEGLWGMSGNAREWTLNDGVHVVESHYEVRGQDDWAREADEAEARSTLAPTLGGSYKEGIQDCTVDFTSLQRLPKLGRWPNVGFRLWRSGSPYG